MKFRIPHPALVEPEDRGIVTWQILHYVVDGECDVAITYDFRFDAPNNRTIGRLALEAA